MRHILALAAGLALALGPATASVAIENQWMEGVTSGSDQRYGSGTPSLDRGEQEKDAAAVRDVMREKPGGPKDPIASQNADQPWAGPDEIFGPADEIPPPREPVPEMGLGF